MTKILVLQQRYNLTDDALEYQLLDCRSSCSFSVVPIAAPSPTQFGWSATAWPKRGLGTKLFDQVQQQLLTHGYLACCGQIIDASLVQVPTQCNKREESEIVSTNKLIFETRKQRKRRIATAGARRSGIWGDALHGRKTDALQGNRSCYLRVASQTASHDLQRLVV